jgi:hypothetical protein
MVQWSLVNPWYLKVMCTELLSIIELNGSLTAHEAVLG